MALIKAQTREGRTTEVYVFRGPTAKPTKFRYASAADTEEKWLEIMILETGYRFEDYLLAAELRPIAGNLVLDHKAVCGKIYVDFDLVDRLTGAVTYSVRQPGSPRPETPKNQVYDAAL